MVTGYIIYSGEVRKNIAAKNPEATFGEVSRMVGNEWRNLPAHMKSEYEEKSQRLNEETAAELARNGTDPATPSGPGTYSFRLSSLNLSALRLFLQIKLNYSVTYLFVFI